MNSTACGLLVCLCESKVTKMKLFFRGEDLPGIGINSCDAGRNEMSTLRGWTNNAAEFQGFEQHFRSLTYVLSPRQRVLLELSSGKVPRWHSEIIKGGLGLKTREAVFLRLT